MLAARLGLPHVSVVIAVEAADGSARVRQEFSGGRSQQLDVKLPAVVGVQASRQPPRYAPITRIRQVMQAGGVQEVTVQASRPESGLTIRRMYTPGEDRARRDAGAAPTRRRIRSSNCCGPAAW